MIQPSLAGLVPLVEGHPARFGIVRRTVLGYFQASLRDLFHSAGQNQKFSNSQPSPF